MISTQVQKGERDAGRDRLECPTRLPQTMEALATILDALGLGDIAEDRISSQKLKGDREAKKKAADTLRRSLARSAWRICSSQIRRAPRVVRAAGRGAGRAGDAAAAGRAVIGGVDGWRGYDERDGVAVAAVRAAGGAGRVVEC